LEPTIRLTSFLLVLVVMAIWELLAPRRPLTVSKGLRWFSNLGIVAIDTALLRLVLPVAAVGTAMVAEQRAWGLFNNVPVPYFFSIILSVAILDFVIYLQHLMFHAVPRLWRVHMMHHTDFDLDVTSGLRFHPVEIVLSMCIKMAAVVLIGAPPVAVVIFEILLNATAMFNHGNVWVPLKLDALLRWVVVTPDMHRVHHSIESRESNSNFGFNLPWWDRLLGTYRAQPAAGHEGMTIGLRQFQSVRRQTLPWLLLVPFRGKPGDYAINRRKYGK